MLGTPFKVNKRGKINGMRRAVEYRMNINREGPVAGSQQGVAVLHNG